MATVQNLVVNLLGNARQFSKTMQSARGDLQTLQVQVQSSVTNIAGQLATLAGIGGAGFGIGKGLQLAAEAEQAAVSFEVLIGSVDRAKKLLTDIQQFAAATPFQQPELIAASRSLLAFGTEAEEIIPTMRRLGDVASGVGQPIGEIAELYGKAKVQGRLFAEDINQLTGRGIPIIQELAKQFGVSEAGVRKLVESGKVNFTNLQQAFESLTVEGGKFGGMMARQSVTLAGLWSTFGDSVGITLQHVGETIAKELNLKGVLESTSATLDSMRSQFTSVAATVAQWAKQIIAVGVALGGVVIAMKAWAAAQKAIAAGQVLVQSLAGPAGWAKLAAGVAIYAGTMMALNETTKQVTAGQADMQTETQAAAATTKILDQAVSGATSKFARMGSEVEKVKGIFAKYATDAQKLKAELQAIANTTRDTDTGAFLTTDQKANFKSLAIEKSTGISSEINKIRDEMELLAGTATETQHKLRDMLAAGAPPEMVERLGKLMEMRDRLKQAMDDTQEKRKELFESVLNEARQNFDRAEEIRQSIKSPAQTLQEELDEIKKLRESNNLTGTEAEIAARQSIGKFMDTQKKRNAEPALNTALEAGSAEGVNALARLLAPKSGRDNLAKAQADNIARIRELQEQQFELNKKPKKTVQVKV